MPSLFELDRVLAQGESQLQEAAWLVQTLAELDALWEVYTPKNRQRLVRALVDEVVVDVRAGEVMVRLIDLSQRMGGTMLELQFEASAAPRFFEQPCSEFKRGLRVGFATRRSARRPERMTKSAFDPGPSWHRQVGRLG